MAAIEANSGRTMFIPKFTPPPLNKDRVTITLGEPLPHISDDITYL